MNRIFGIYSENKTISVPKGFYELVNKENLYVNNQFTDKGLYTCEISKKKKDSSKGLNHICIDGAILNFDELKQEYGKNFLTQKDFLNYIYHKKPSKWPRYINGSLSASIYDKDKKKLSILRDHFGSKPLYYYDSEDVFVFASEIKYILSVVQKKMTPNTKKISQYICQYKENNYETFYNEIYSIPPSHNLEITKNGLKINKFEFFKDYSFKGNNINQASLELRNILKKAIENCLNQNKKTGILVSGGLDSSAIYAISKKLNNTYDAIPVTMNFYDLNGNLLACDESEFQDELLKDDKKINIQFKQQSPFEVVDFYLDVFDQPTNLANIYLWDETYRKASLSGISGLIDGFDGDNIFSHGWYRFNELFKISKIFIFFKELYLFDKNHTYDEYTSRPMWKKILMPLIKNTFFFKPFVLLRNLFNRKKRISRVIKKDILRTIPFEEIYDEMKMFKKHEEFLANPNIDLAFTNLNILAFKYGINQQSPLFDLSVTEFCKSLPSHMKLKNGVSRNIIREVMKDDLPNKILNRFTKANLTENFMRKVSKEDLNNIENEILNIHPLIEHSIDKDLLMKEFILFKKLGKNEKVLMNIWCFYQANKWLKKMF